MPIQTPTEVRKAFSEERKDVIEKKRAAYQERERARKLAQTQKSRLRELKKAESKILQDVERARRTADANRSLSGNPRGKPNVYQRNAQRQQSKLDMFARAQQARLDKNRSQQKSAQKELKKAQSSHRRYTLLHAGYVASEKRLKERRVTALSASKRAEKLAEAREVRNERQQATSITNQQTGDVTVLQPTTGDDEIQRQLNARRPVMTPSARRAAEAVVADVWSPKDGDASSSASKHDRAQFKRNIARSIDVIDNTIDPATNEPIKIDYNGKRLPAATALSQGMDPRELWDQIQSRTDISTEDFPYKGVISWK